MKPARTHPELERIQMKEELLTIERERALEDIILLMRRHQISVDELQQSIQLSSVPQRRNA